MCGTFDVKNLGDMLFPYVLRHELGKRILNLEVECFSYHSKQESEWPYSVTSITQLAEVIDSFDAVVIGGGHLVRFDKDVAPGYFPPGPDFHHPTSYWLYPAMLANSAKVPVIWSTVGTSPDPPSWGRELLSKAIQGSAYVSVRDADSLHLFESLMTGQEIRKVPDMVFGINNVLESLRSKWRGKKQERRYVLLQANPHLRGYARSLRALVRSLREADYEVRLFAVSPALGGDADVMRDIVGLDTAEMPWRDPLDAVEAIANASGVVGLSLHLSIVALAFGVPVLRPGNESLLKYHALDGIPGIYPLEHFADHPTQFLNSLKDSGKRSSFITVYEAALKYHWDRIAQIARLPASQRCRPENANNLRELPFSMESIRALP